jgi:hypothetical protein
MTNEELIWMREVYQCYIVPGADKSNALHCSHWSNLLFTVLKANKYKIILSNDKHSCLFIDGVHVDLQYNAFIVGFDWKSTAITPEARIAPINPKFPPKKFEIYRFYAKPATHKFTLWKEEVV